MDLSIEKKGDEYHIYRKIIATKEDLEKYTNNIQNSVKTLKLKVEDIERKRYQRQVKKEVENEFKVIEKNVKYNLEKLKELRETIETGNVEKLIEFVKGHLNKLNEAIEAGQLTLNDRTGILKDELAEIDAKKNSELLELKEELYLNEIHLREYKKALKQK